MSQGFGQNPRDFIANHVAKTGQTPGKFKKPKRGNTGQ